MSTALSSTPRSTFFSGERLELFDLDLGLHLDARGERERLVDHQLAVVRDLRVGDDIDLVLFDGVDVALAHHATHDVVFDLGLEPLLENPSRHFARAKAGDLHLPRQLGVGIVELFGHDRGFDLDGE